MSAPAPVAAPAKPTVWNVPNQVTTSRIVLAIVLFALLSWHFYFAALIAFIVAASTDWVDGYWARKYGQVTKLGRILDPFADKMIICGVFIYLAASPQLPDGSPASGVAAWMAVLILARELGVTALRSFVEMEGGDFSAKWAGKWKMVAQCLAAGFSLALLQYYDLARRDWGTPPPPDWIRSGTTFTVWLAIGLTVYSGLEYVWIAARLLRRAD